MRDLHPRFVDGATSIFRLLESARRNYSVFHRGLNRQVDLETARLETIESGELIFLTRNFDRDLGSQIFFNFTLNGRPYFFSSIRSAPYADNRLVVKIPERVYYSERRDRLRRLPEAGSGDPSLVKIAFQGGEAFDASVIDISPGGMGLQLPRPAISESDSLVDLEFLDGRKVGWRTRAQLRNWRPIFQQPGWIRVGVVQTDAMRINPIRVEYWTAMTDGAKVIREPEPSESYVASLLPKVLRLANRRKEEIVCLVDSWGELRGSTAVVIPNSWGQTKEATLPLARTIVATFRSAGIPICVVRFDGIRKRGESHNDPPCRIPGCEYLHYTFSQGVEDIEDVSRFLRTSPNFEASSVILVTFSAAAIEARKVLAGDEEGLISGWISIVGAPDLQSMARSISGGIDLMGGSERGLKFGIQELLGVTVDIDRIVSDGLTSNLLFIDDARDDFSKITIPITWYHGIYDSWIEIDRVQDVLAIGNPKNRRLLVMPTGHQLRNSSDARQAFASIAAEIGRIMAGWHVVPKCASAREIRGLRKKERGRSSQQIPDLRCFWKDYLMGRDRSFGIELLNSGSSYCAMMEQQFGLLRLRNGDRVIDLGSGVGAFGVFLATRQNLPTVLNVNSIDYVREAHQRARARISKKDLPEGVQISYIDADLNLLNEAHHMPIADEVADAILASLLLSYLERPELVLMEIWRLLKAGGRVVISSLAKDCDISRLYRESAAELTVGDAGNNLPGFEREQLPKALRNFLNDAARILELEEAGAFRFWEAEELIELMQLHGFREVEARKSLGNPPQAILVSGIKN